MLTLTTLRCGCVCCGFHCQVEEGCYKGYQVELLLACMVYYMHHAYTHHFVLWLYLLCMLWLAVSGGRKHTRCQVNQFVLDPNEGFGRN
jgi:hypothetical protein